MLKQIKKEYGPIHDSIVEGKYPNFAEESIKLILASPLNIYISGNSYRVQGKIFSTSFSINLGKAAISSSNSSSMQTDSSSDEKKAEQAVKESAARKE